MIIYLIYLIHGAFAVTLIGMYLSDKGICSKDRKIINPLKASERLELYGKLSIIAIVIWLIADGGKYIFYYYIFTHNVSKALIQTIAHYIDFLNVFAFYIGFTVFSFWFYRAFSNIELIRVEKTKWDPVWAVLSVWITVVSPFLPPIIMKELAIMSTLDKKRDYASIRIIWWIALILSYIISFFVNLALMGHTTYTEKKVAVFFGLLGWGLFIVSGLSLAILILRINKDQNIRLKMENDKE